MESEFTFGSLKVLLKRAPMILKTMLINLLSLSPASDRQSLRMELTVAVIKSFISFDHGITEAQRRSIKAPPIKGRMWIATSHLPKPQENDALDSLLKVIEHLKEGDETYVVPELVDLEAEWTGYRHGVSPKTPPPNIPEEEKYKNLMAEVKDDLTILYFHGGAYYLMDPATHRGVTKKLAKLTRGRCISVRYRLAPQFPFPAAILDALVAYLYLLSPAPGSFHTPVPANKIVFAGDSAGGGISLALLQTLLTLKRISPTGTIRFHGKDVPIELPAGVAVNSPFTNATLSLPSTIEMAKYDYIPPAPQRSGALFTSLPFKEDSAWPASPPRVDLYANASSLTHPLVSPLAASADSWKDTPPIYMVVGDEILHDDSIYLSRKVHGAGGNVVLQYFEGMPHCFALIAADIRAGKRCFQDWATFCLDAVHGRLQRTEYAEFINHNATKTENRKLAELGSLTDEEVKQTIIDSKNWRLEGERELLRKWEQTTDRAKL